MTRMPVWIIGRGGLLGSHLEQALAKREDREVWPPHRVAYAWNSPATLRQELARSAQVFAETVRKNGGPWMVLWAAGTGVMSTPAPQLAKETAVLRACLQALETELQGCPAGTFFFSSSAGALYAYTAAPVTEATPVSPLGYYGAEKLKQEQLVRAFGERLPQAAVLIGRLTNLYGERQSMQKAQGLISHLSRCIIRNLPAHIFVPLDTARDYLFAGDAAAMILDACALPRSQRIAMQIFASGQSITVAELIGLFRRIAKRPARIVCAAAPRGAKYPRHVRFRADHAPRTGIVEGVHRVHLHQLQLLAQGKLA